MSFKEAVVLTLNKKLNNFKKAVSKIGHTKRRSKDSKQTRPDSRQSLEILNDENGTLKRQIKEKQAEIERVKQENAALKEEYENKETLFEEDRRFLCEEINSLRREIQEKEADVRKCRQENEGSNEALKKEYESKEALFEEDKNFLCEEVKSLKKRLCEKETEVEKIRQENILLREEREKKDGILKEEFNNKLALFREDKRNLEKEISKLKNDLENVYKGRVKHIKNIHFEGGNNKLLEEVESLNVVLELKQNEIKNMRLAIAEAKQKEEALELTMRKVQLLQTRCEDLQEQLQRKNETEQSLVKENSKLRENVLQECSQKRRLSYQNEELQWKLKKNRKLEREDSEKIDINPEKSPVLPRVKRVIRKRESVGYIINIDGESPEKN